MSQYFLNCLERGETAVLSESQELSFAVSESDYERYYNENESIPGCFLLLHRGHPLMFTTKE